MLAETLHLVHNGLSLQTCQVTVPRALAAPRLQEVTRQELTTTTSSQPLLLMETAAPAHVNEVSA